MFAPLSLGFAGVEFHSDKLHSQSQPHHLDNYCLSLSKGHLFIHCHNYRISPQLVILPAEGKIPSPAVIYFMCAIYKYSILKLEIGDISCCERL
jgi:hypothetical protein